MILERQNCWMFPNTGPKPRTKEATHILATVLLAIPQGQYQQFSGVFYFQHCSSCPPFSSSLLFPSPNHVLSPVKHFSLSQSPHSSSFSQFPLLCFFPPPFQLSLSLPHLNSSPIFPTLVSGSAGGSTRVRPCA